MNCDQFRALLDSYLDREIEPRLAREAEGHLRACPGCRMALDDRARLSAAVKTSAEEVFNLPAGLKESVLARLSAGTEPPALRAWRLPRWIGMAAAAALAMAVGSAVTFLLAVPSDGERLIDNAISAHARSLQVDHLTDVASSDPAAVKTWFKAQEFVVPAVKDLSSAGFELVGGRLDYLYKHPVAAVVYSHKGRTINLYTWSAKDEGSASMEEVTDEGFNLVLWRSSGTAFCAISELGAADLVSFAKTFASFAEPS